MYPGQTYLHFIQYRNTQTAEQRRPDKEHDRERETKWEKEGDNLYVNHNQQQDNGDAGRRHPIKDITYDQARELLRPFESIDAIPIQASKSTASTSINDEEDHFKAEPPFLWGGLSVGPVWKSRLVQAGFDTPTPIQKASYHTLSNKKECRPSQVFIAVNW